MVDPRDQMLCMQMQKENEQAEKQRQMEALTKGQQDIFLQDLQNPRSPIRGADPLAVWAKAQQSGFDPNMAMGIANMSQPQSVEPMSAIAKLMQDRVNIAKANPNDPRLAQLDAVIQQKTNPQSGS